MKENGAPPALNSGAQIVASLNDDIVEMVRALQIFVSGWIGQIDTAVVVPVAHRFAPAPTAANWGGGNHCAGPGDAVIPIENLQQAPHSDWAAAVSLPLA